MIDIQEDLKRIKEKWNNTYISIYDLFSYLKASNKQLSAKEIAEYLLIKLDKFNLDSINKNDYPDFFKDKRFLDLEDKNEFVKKYGFPCYRKKDNFQAEIYYSNPDLFFDFLRNIKYSFMLLPDTEVILDEYGMEKAYANNAYIERHRIKQALENLNQEVSYDFSQSSTENALRQAQETIEKQAKRIAELEAKNLTKLQPPESAVDCDKYSIYGHTSENIEMLFHLCEKISNLCDPDNPHSYPDKKEIEEYIKKYHSDSSKLAEAIYQVITPNKVKQRGRKPNGVDTFKGFI